MLLSSRDESKTCKNHKHDVESNLDPGERTEIIICQKHRLAKVVKIFWRSSGESVKNRTLQNLIIHPARHTFNPYTQFKHTQEQQKQAIFLKHSCLCELFFTLTVLQGFPHCANSDPLHVSIACSLHSKESHLHPGVSLFSVFSKKVPLL